MNGGNIALTKHWAQYLLERIEFVKRKSTTKVKVSVKDLEELKKFHMSLSQLGSDRHQLCACLKLNNGKTRL